MAITVIKSHNSDNQVEVTDNNELKVTGTFTADNASVGSNGAPIPVESSLIAGQDPSGNLAPLQTDASGALKIAGTVVFATQDVRVLFNEVEDVIVGLETTINTYTAPMSKIAYLLSIINSGENRAEYRVYLDGNLLDKQYTNVTQLTAPFDYKTGAASVPGMVIPEGQVVDVKVINSGSDLAGFNSRFLILEVTL